jgi:hypothetical protein
MITAATYQEPGRNVDVSERSESLGCSHNVSSILGE